MALVAGSLPAATISVTATANSSYPGYVLGNPYTFTFVTNPTFTTTPNSTVSLVNMRWEEAVAADDQLYTGITSNALVGSFVRPATPPDDPNAVLEVEKDFGGPGSDSMLLHIRSENWNSLGFDTLGGVEVVGINVFIPDTGVSLAYSGTYAQPESILAAINGLHTPGTGGILSLGGGNESEYSFTVTSFTITNDPPPVDVPFGVDFSLGLGLLGLASAWKLSRRRRG